MTLRTPTAAETVMCRRCGRSASATRLGTTDHMVQPDGDPCGGTFVVDNREPPINGGMGER